MILAPIFHSIMAIYIYGNNTLFKSQTEELSAINVDVNAPGKVDIFI
jgi:hypothetical protein